MSTPTLARTSARTIDWGGRELVAFAGADYLGLAHEPSVIEVLCATAQTRGVSAGASRATSGSAPEHLALEAGLAEFLGTEAALLAPDGATANLIAAEALAPVARHALVDEQAHATILSAARAAGLTLTTYAHLDAHRARELAGARPSDGAVIACDGFFPWSGESAPLEELARAASNPRVFLWIDDAHAVGVLGARGAGSSERLSPASNRLVVTGSLSKALGTCGGFVAGSRSVVAGARAAPTYVGTTPIPPAIAAAASTALALARDPARRARLFELVEQARQGWRELGLALGPTPFPILAIEARNGLDLCALQDELVEAGLFAPLASYLGHADSLLPALNAAHTQDDVRRLLDALRSHLRVRA